MSRSLFNAPDLVVAAFPAVAPVRPALTFNAGPSDSAEPSECSFQFRAETSRA